MNEETAVLDFFAKKENLSLGLSVGEQMDEIRIAMNSAFWKTLQERLNTLFQQQTVDWEACVIEDRNAAEVLVGVQCKFNPAQPLYLFPMLEQQYLGGVWRIFFGLMWSTAPATTQLALPAVTALKQTLVDSGFKTNESFLGWQWTNFYPRRRDFLLRYSQQPEKLFAEVEAQLARLLVDQRELITTANAALRSLPVSMTISLDQLHRSKQI
jgi:hypothetical protein